MASREAVIALGLLVVGLILLYATTENARALCQIPWDSMGDSGEPKIGRQFRKEKNSEERKEPLTFDLADIRRECRRDTGSLIQAMRETQRRVNRLWRNRVGSPRERWEVFPEVFDPPTAGFKLLLRPFKYYSGDENKFFLEMSDPTAICHHITVGVGGTWEGEKALRKRYPQCSMVGIDPGYENRRLVESIPRSRFLHAALHYRGGNMSAELLGPNGYYAGKVVPHRAFYEVLIQNSNGNTIDFMTIDTEGAEFSLLRTLHTQRHMFAKVCQFNVEMHFAPRHYDVSLAEFDQLLNEFFEESHFVLLNVASRGFELRQLFFVNVGDRECIQKFLC